jgi:hypothetical protein
MAHKEYELTHSVLRYAAACLREGDWHALRDLGFGPQETEALEEIRIADLALLEHKLSGHVLRVKLDSAAFQLTMDQLKHETERRSTIMECIRRDAPAEMMQTCFGMGVKEYTQARRIIGAPSGVGRPNAATDEEARVVWLAWEQLGRDPSEAMPDDWLRIAIDTGISLRLIWGLAQRWKHGG